jgi:CubicO group peptidase (beta-lactamase class C family)
MVGGAWPFLVGGVICLVDSDNERDSQSKMVLGSNLRYTRPLFSTIRFKRKEAESNNRSVMPLDVLGYTRATMTSSTSFTFLARKGVGNLFNARRDGARFLQLLIFNEESLVCAVHQTAQNASLPFVHTARRTYRLDDPARSLELRFVLISVET